MGNLKVKFGNFRFKGTLVIALVFALIAAILFVVAYNMCGWREFVAIIKTKKWNDILVLVLTFVLTVVFDLVKAIAVGLAVHYLIVLINYIIKKRNAKKESK